MSGPEVTERLAPRARVLAIVEVVTVGLPFCAFKAVAGFHLARTPSAEVVGGLLVVLGGIDGVLNVVSGFAVVATGRRPWPVCVLHGAFSLRGGRRRRSGELGLALDMALSFSLVAAMVAWNQIAALPRLASAVWSAAVVLNVLGAGALRVADAVRSESDVAPG